MDYNYNNYRTKAEFQKAMLKLSPHRKKVDEYRHTELCTEMLRRWQDQETQWRLSDTDCKLPPEALDSNRRLDIELSFL